MKEDIDIILIAGLVITVFAVFGYLVIDMSVSVAKAKDTCAESTHPFYKTSTSDYIICLNEQGQQKIIGRGKE